MLVSLFRNAPRNVKKVLLSKMVISIKGVVVEFKDIGSLFGGPFLILFGNHQK